MGFLGSKTINYYVGYRPLSFGAKIELFHILLDLNTHKMDLFSTILGQNKLFWNLKTSNHLLYPISTIFFFIFIIFVKNFAPRRLIKPSFCCFAVKSLLHGV